MAAQTQARTRNSRTKRAPLEIGYTLSSEEHHPNDLVANAVTAEGLGFEFVSISDHFHPWVNAQPHSPFVWSTLGGVAAATTTIGVGVGVACPILRVHPAIVAQAAATCGAMMEGRFFLGLGTGELLNEHILGQKWPRIETRQRMLAEAIEVIRLLWKGDVCDFDGEFFTVENARIHTLPETLPPLVMSGFGPTSARLAAELDCGLWTTGPNDEVLDAYRDAGGRGDIVGQLSLCWAKSRKAGVATAYEYWPTKGIGGQVSQELPSPALFEQAASAVTQQDIAGSVPCGPDAGPVLEAVEEYRDKGFTRLHLHQMGPDQAGFFNFWEEKIRPQLDQ